MNFKDKVVLVTGSSSGIGAAIALQFAAYGAEIAIVGRNKEKLAKVAKMGEKNSSKPLIIIADVTKDDDLKKIITETIGTFGKIDVLINNAGIAITSEITDNSAMQHFDKAIASNLRSVVYLTQLAVHHLIATKGTIINISSNISNKPSPKHFAYCVSKAGLDHFTRCIALELAHTGVRVNTVNPGPVKTDILSNIGVPEEQQPKIWDWWKNRTALGHVSEPEEVSDLVIFLASDSARGITGSLFLIDNGLSLKHAE